ncbi:hypothetical protein HDU80_002091 [Chytriomyces hyalinus]|nr:hypothetical protein HDU80_002091 [Chytriomyces hyalinus]
MLLSADSFCTRVDILLPTLNSLSKKLGMEAAVALLSTNSFCVRVEALLPILDSLSTAIGTNYALSDKLGTEAAVRLLSWNGFCVRVDELMAKVPDIEAVLGEKGAVRVLSNPYLVSMDTPQWQEFMEFIRNAQPGDAMSYLGSILLVGKCKRVGWGICSDLYQLASQQERTRAGFEKLMDAYAQEAL